MYHASLVHGGTAETSRTSGAGRDPAGGTLVIVNPKHINHLYDLLSLVSLIAAVLSAMANAIRSHNTVTATATELAHRPEVK